MIRLQQREIAVRFAANGPLVELLGGQECGLTAVHRDGQFALLRGEPCKCTDYEEQCPLWSEHTKFVLGKKVRSEEGWDILRVMQQAEPGHEWPGVVKEMTEVLGQLSRYESKYKPPKRPRVKL